MLIGRRKSTVVAVVDASLIVHWTECHYSNFREDDGVVGAYLLWAVPLRYGYVIYNKPQYFTLDTEVMIIVEIVR